MSKPNFNNAGYRGVPKKGMSKGSQILIVIIIMLVLISAVLAYGIIKKKTENAIIAGVDQVVREVALESVVEKPEVTTVHEQSTPAVNPTVKNPPKLNSFDGRNIKYNFNTRIQDAEYQEKIINFMSQHNIAKTKRNKLAKQIVKVGRQENLDPYLMTATIYVVSAFKDRAVSPDGRIGLLQIHPKFVEALNKKLDFSRYNLANLSDIPTNLHIGSRILKHFINDSENPLEGVAFFYWGSGTQTRQIGLFEIMPQQVSNFAIGVYNTMEEVTKAEFNEDVVEENDVDARYPTKEQVIEDIFVKLSVRESNGLSRLIVRESEHYGVDPMLMLGVMAVTSKVQHDLKTADGHYGLMYIKAKNGAELAKKTKMMWAGENRLLSASYNIQMGVRYYAFLKKIFKDDEKTLAAYLLDPKEYITALKKKQELPATLKKQIQSIFNAQKRFNDRLNIPLPPEKEYPTEELIALEKVKKTATPFFQQYKKVVKPEIVNAKPTPTPHQTHYFKDEIAKIKYIAESYGVINREANDLAYRIVLACEKLNLEPSFVAAIIANESNFFVNARVRKPVEKVGLFQISVADGRKIANFSHVSWAGASELKDPDYSLRLGTNYIKAISKKYHTHKEILGAFYMGVDNYAAARASGRGVPRDIAQHVTDTLNIYKSWKKDYVISKK